MTAPAPPRRKTHIPRVNRLLAVLFALVALAGVTLMLLPLLLW